jgi:GntR family transcriptional regulator
MSKAYQILVSDDRVKKKRGLGMHVGEGVREQLLKDERQGFIDPELLEFQDRVQLLSFTLKDFLQEVS